MSMLRRVLDRESLVKTNLAESLVDCVKELQLKYAAQRGGALKNDESTNNLCWILEAIFIHGLKNRFLKSMSSVLTANQGTEPSFWEFVLVFCHQEVIMQILQLNLINTDVGRCRAWLRVAINDGLLISYLQLMLGDKSSLRDYYKPSAFLRDSDRCDIIKSYLYGIESYDFQLAFNSSLLNTWNSGPLSLVGLWTPSDSISQGIDVAGNMDDKDLQALPQLHNQARTPPKPSLFSLENNGSSFRVPLLEEDEALRVILSSRGSTGSRSATSSRRNSDGTGTSPSLPFAPGIALPVSTPVTSKNLCSKDDMVSNDLPPILSSNKNLLRFNLITTDKAKDPVSTSTTSAVLDSASESILSNIRDNPKETALVETISSKENVLLHVPRNSSAHISTPEEELSYAALFDNYKTATTMGSPSVGGGFFDISSFGSNKFGLTLNTTTTSSDPALGSSLEENRSVSLPPIDAYTQRIPKEIGLDTQNYKCRSCDRPIGMIYGSVRVCGFTGYYYCWDCHGNDEFVIPSRVILNWDFTRYLVSKEAKDFLTELLERPVFDIEEINPQLYKHVEECSDILILRVKLQSISIYLRTCREPIMQDFVKGIWPKEYLFESTHIYSLSDLLNVPNKVLFSQLVKLVTLGETHIKNCDHCKLKGFVCEVCQDNQLIFPFDLKNIFKCSKCGAVYHNKCMDNGKPCPRCKRWKVSAYDADLTCL